MSKVIRIKDLAPETYSNQSRDFQMLCRLIDLMINSQSARVDQLFQANVPELCDQNFLQLLSKKLGYDYKVEIFEDELRTILTCFKYLVSYKGSLTGITGAVNLFMNIKHKYFKYSINVDTQNSIIYIDIEDDVVHDVEILTDVLRYILPCGYILKYRPLVKIALNDDPDLLAYAQDVDMTIINSVNNTRRSIKSPTKSGQNWITKNIPEAQGQSGQPTGTESRIVNSFNTMQVVAADHIIGKAIRVDVAGESDEDNI